MIREDYVVCTLLERKESKTLREGEKKETGYRARGDGDQTMSRQSLQARDRSRWDKLLTSSRIVVEKRSVSDR